MKLLCLLLLLRASLEVLVSCTRKANAAGEGRTGPSRSEKPSIPRWGEMKSRLVIQESKKQDEGGSKDLGESSKSRQLWPVASTSSEEESENEPEDLLVNSGYHAASDFIREDNIQDALQLILALSRNASDVHKLKEGALEALSRFSSSDSVELLKIFRQLVQNQVSGDTLAKTLRSSRLAFAFPKLKEAIFSILTGIKDRNYFITVTQVMGDYFGWGRLHEETPKNATPEQHLILRLMTAINLGDGKEVMKLIQSHKLNREAAAHIVRAVYDYMVPILPNIPEMWEIVNALASTNEIPVESMNLLAVQYLEEMSKENGPGLKPALISFATNCPNDQVKSFAISQMARREISAPSNVLKFVTSMIDDEIPFDILENYMEQVRPRLKHLPELGSPSFTKELGEALSSIKKPEALLSRVLLCKAGGLLDEHKAAEQLKSAGFDECQHKTVLLYDAIHNHDERQIRSLASHLKRACTDDYLKAAAKLGLQGEPSKSSKVHISEIITRSSRNGKERDKRRGNLTIEELEEESSGSESEEERTVHKHKPKMHRPTVSRSKEVRKAVGSKAARAPSKRHKKGSATRGTRSGSGHGRTEEPRFWIVSERGKGNQ